MTRKLKLIIYSVAAVSTGLVLYSAFQGSRYTALFFSALGYQLLNELYKLDKFQNYEDSEHRKKPNTSLLKREFNIGLLLIPLLGFAIYGIIFK